MTDAIIDLFAGPGGWDLGARWAGLPDPIGIEYEANACATRAAAGLATIRADLTEFPPRRRHITGLIASPPCPAFSMAGKGHGRALLAELVAAVHHGRWDDRPSDDPGVWLVLEVGRWIDATSPDWIALEQVPAVLPIWHAYVRMLRARGYSADTAVLNAADYGVPQTRRRAVLVAHRTRTVTLPAPSHGRSPEPSLFGPVIAQWVTMADALGFHDVKVGFPRKDDLGTSEDGYLERDWRTADEPAFTLTEKGRSTVIVSVNTGQTIPVSPPAPTLTGQSGSQWHLQPGGFGGHNRPPVPVADAPAPTLAFGNDAASWVFERPATTVAGDSRVWPPGHKVNQGDIDRLGEDEARAKYGDRAGSEAIRLTPAQALVLQSFPPDWPVQGGVSAKFQQIGNAVPPLLARRVLEVLL